MPELPEVEVAARNLRRWLTGRTIVAVEPRDGSARIFRPDAPATLDALAGARFHDLRRVGKNLLLTLDTDTGPLGLWSHLGMTGKWLRRGGGDPEPPFSRLMLELDDRTLLFYADTRIFGRVRLVPGAAFEEVQELTGLGPDPLIDGIDPEALYAKLQTISKPIKVAIMDQALLPGVGNIQASEGLYRSAIDPRRPARSLSKALPDLRPRRGAMSALRLHATGHHHADHAGATRDLLLPRLPEIDLTMSRSTAGNLERLVAVRALDVFQGLTPGDQGGVAILPPHLGNPAE